MEEIKHLVEVTDKGLKIIDEELMEQVKKKNLSPSMVSSFFQCPADWLMDSFILRKMEYEEPIHFARGHIFHDSMEAFFTLPPEERTKEMLGKTATSVIREKYSQYLTDRETMKWVMDALKGYLDVNPDYKEDRIPRIIVNEKERLGLEYFASTPVGKTKRRVVGFVDKMILTGDTLEDGVIIEDYKTGKNVAKFDPDKPINKDNDFGYWRQQLYYVIAMEQAGYKVKGARLTFPIAGQVVEIDVHNENLRKQVEADFEELERQLDLCIEQNLFPFKGHFWCAWCGTLHPNFRARKKPQVNYQELVQYVKFQEY